jgi:hypothetical protein
MIYFAFFPARKIVKIGRSIEPEKRVRALEYRFGIKLEIVNIVRGSWEEERLAHVDFVHLRIWGEWFSFAEEMRSWRPPDQTLYNDIRLRQAMRTVRDLVKDAGGPLVVSKALDRSKGAVFSWYSAGIPTEFWNYFMDNTGATAEELFWADCLVRGRDSEAEWSDGRPKPWALQPKL